VLDNYVLYRIFSVITTTYIEKLNHVR